MLAQPPFSTPWHSCRCITSQPDRRLATDCIRNNRRTRQRLAGITASPLAPASFFFSHPTGSLPNWGCRPLTTCFSRAMAVSRGGGRTLTSPSASETKLSDGCSSYSTIHVPTPSSLTTTSHHLRPPPVRTTLSSLCVYHTPLARSRVSATATWPLPPLFQSPLFPLGRFGNPTHTMLLLEARTLSRLTPDRPHCVKEACQYKSSRPPCSALLPLGSVSPDVGPARRCSPVLAGLLRVPT